ncbi:MAG: hypothetical protein K0V04_37360 [Deltaproteobacteria bacterium]|nr:hypothetical protein [Deltaproteobacteria bacterium]
MHMTRTTISISLLALCVGALACSGDPASASDPKPAASVERTDATAVPEIKADPSAPALAPFEVVALGPVDIAVSDEAKAAAKAIVASNKDIYDDAIEPESLTGPAAEAYVWLAADSSDPEVVADALSMLSGVDPLPASVVPLLEARLRNTDTFVLQALDGLLRDAVEQPALASNEALVNALVAAVRSHTHGYARRAAARALAALPSDSPHAGKLLTTIDPGLEPYLLVALLPRHAQRDARAPELLAAQLSLLSHPSPYVRGIVAQLAPNSAPKADADLAAKLVSLLDDPEPFVRCRALMGLRTMRVASTIGAVAARLSDDAPCKIEYQGPTSSGTMRAKVATFSDGPSVSYRAVETTTTLSHTTKTPLNVGLLDRKDAAVFAKQVATAKAWAKAQG